jgi:hypothetical protein
MEEEREAQMEELSYLRAQVSTLSSQLDHFKSKILKQVTNTKDYDREVKINSSLKYDLSKLRHQNITLIKQIA